MTKLFTKFNPGHDKEAEDFAKQLPEFKLSMAKLQGHFLKYRDDPEGASANAKELL